jgi:hypothetical protein
MSEFNALPSAARAFAHRRHSVHAACHGTRELDLACIDDSAVKTDLTAAREYPCVGGIQFGIVQCLPASRSNAARVICVMGAVSCANVSMLNANDVVATHTVSAPKAIRCRMLDLINISSGRRFPRRVVSAAYESSASQTRRRRDTMND